MDDTLSCRFAYLLTVMHMNVLFCINFLRISSCNIWKQFTMKFVSDAILKGVLNHGHFFFLKKKEAAKPQRSAEPALKKRETVNVPGRIGNANCKYKYDGVGISLMHGVNLDSIFAQRATFDSSYSPVAVLVNGQAIGSLNNDKLSEMVYDWNRRGEPIFAIITHVDDERNEAVLDLFFYRDELKYLLRRFPDDKA